MKSWFESVRFILTLNMNLVKMVKSSQGADSIHLNGLYFGYGALSAVMMTTPPHSMDYWKVLTPTSSFIKEGYFGRTKGNMFICSGN